MEQYQPKQEEIKKAEEMMTPEQGIRSDVREDFIEKREKAGVSSDVEYKYENKEISKRGESGTRKISIEDRGHKIEIDLFGGKFFNGGTIDGLKLTAEEAQKIRDKYDKLEAMSLNKEGIVAENKIDDYRRKQEVKQQVEKEQQETLKKEQLLKDILG